MRSKKLLAVAFMLLFVSGLAFAGAMDIPEGAQCHLCGMKVDPGSAYSAQAVKDGEMIPYCDIGDMLYEYNKEDEKPSELYVRDNPSGEWIDAAKAVYVKSEDFDTPMSWGIAAFADMDEAAKSGNPMTFEEALGSLGGGMMKGKMKMKGKM